MILIIFIQSQEVSTSTSLRILRTCSSIDQCDLALLLYECIIALSQDIHLVWTSLRSGYGPISMINRLNMLGMSIWMLQSPVTLPTDELDVRLEALVDSTFTPLIFSTLYRGENTTTYPVCVLVSMEGHNSF